MLFFLPLDANDKGNSTNLNRITKIDLKIFNHVNNSHNLSRQCLVLKAVLYIL